MSGRIEAIFRHPIKGFTPEAIEAAVRLEPGEGFPHDRVWAVENGPSGYDPLAPAFVPKQKFCVLAAIPTVAAVRTRYDDQTGRMSAEAPGRPAYGGDFQAVADRDAFAAWLTPLLAEDLRGPLAVVTAPPHHRFTDHPQGQVSVVNLASVRDLGVRMGVEIDPLRFRSNLYVEGWPPWVEDGWTGRGLALGGVGTQVFKPIVRCAATHVDPLSAVRDLEITRALFENYGHMNLGLYVHVTKTGEVAVGDPARVMA
jgi:uncharacterized protein YcbX